MPDKSFANGNEHSHVNGNGLAGPTADWQLNLARSQQEHWWLRV
jgi:hypothetical protein